jgi:hypothetical protein
LIRHDDRGAIVGIEVGVFESTGKRQRRFLEIGVGEPDLFPVAIGFDQANFSREAVQSIT